MTIEERILFLRSKNDSEWHKPRIGVYHASAIYDIVKGKIKAKDFFKKEKFSATTLLTFEIGNMYHKHIQSLYPKDSVERKIKIQIEDFIIVGSIDLVLEGIPCELKTCSTFPIKHYPAHEYQLQTYLQGLNADYGFLTYIEKNPKIFSTKNYKVKRNPEIWVEIVEKLKKFHAEVKVAQDVENKKLDS